jgi:hypothetical protein
VQSQLFRAWKLELITSHVSSPKSYVPSMTWMPTWEHVLEVWLGTYVESWVEQKIITLFSRVCTLGGAANKPNSIQNNTLFILPTEHYTGMFRLKYSGEVVD